MKDGPRVPYAATHWMWQHLSLKPSNQNTGEAGKGGLPTSQWEELLGCTWPQDGH